RARRGTGSNAGVAEGSRGGKRTGTGKTAAVEVHDAIGGDAAAAKCGGSRRLGEAAVEGDYAALSLHGSAVVESPLDRGGSRARRFAEGRPGQIAEADRPGLVVLDVEEGAALVGPAP